MAEIMPLPDRRYSVIYADPPWAYRQRGDTAKSRGNAAKHYQTMDTAAICAMPVPSICAEGAACFMWATFPNIAEAIKVMEAWGFRYVMGCKGSKAALVVLTERLTRYPVIIRVPDHTMESVVRALDRMERRMGAKFREVFRSITVDNGCEFQDCKGMERSKRARKPRTKIYYCHPYSAYERGSNENMNRIIRRFFPKGTNFDTITAAEVAQVEEWLANYPRRLLDWKTPQMLYDKYMTVAA